MKRIQRKREKGWKMPENTVYVGRPTKWGNPFKLVGDCIYVNASHRRKEFDPWVFLCHGDDEKVVRLYKSVVTGFMQFGEYGIEVDMLHDVLYWATQFKKLEVAELKGKNLACFCSLDKPCHVDVLLETLNN